MQRLKDEAAILRAAEKLGVEAKIISPAEVATGDWVRWKCQYGCGGYGQALTCPPHSPAPEQTRRVLDSYRRALLLHLRDGGDMAEIAVTLERQLFLSGFYRAFGFGSGPCRRCDECNLESCAHPRQARPSMEACGIDVFQTARAQGFPIEVLTSTRCTGNYYGLVLIE